MALSDTDQIMAEPEETTDRNTKEPQDESIEMHVKVVVDQDHPFDLEAYISQYSGN
jgi:hypothetical protein